MEKEVILEAIKALGETDLAKRTVDLKKIKNDQELAEVFLVAVESVDPKKERELPKIVSDTYNALVEEIEGKTGEAEVELPEEVSKPEVKETKKGKETKQKMSAETKEETKVVETVKEAPKKPVKEKKEKGGSAKEICRKLVAEGKSKEEVKKTITKLYMDTKGVDEKYAASRANAVYCAIVKEGKPAEE